MPLVLIFMHQSQLQLSLSAFSSDRKWLASSSIFNQNCQYFVAVAIVDFSPMSIVKVNLYHRPCQTMSRSKCQSKHYFDVIASIDLVFSPSYNIFEVFNSILLTLLSVISSLLLLMLFFIIKIRVATVTVLASKLSLFLFIKKILVPFIRSHSF